MAVYADRVKETTTTTGTGTYSLAGAVTGYQTFVAGASSGATVTYCCTDNTDWEVGEGVVTSGSPATLTRATILASSNANAAVNWSAGTRDIFVTAAASRIAITDRPNTFAEPQTVPAGNVTVPGIRIGSDTGLYRSANNTVSFSTGGNVPAVAIPGSNTVVSGWKIEGATAGNMPYIYPTGAAADIGISIDSKGNGLVTFGTTTNGFSASFYAVPGSTTMSQLYTYSGYTETYYANRTNYATATQNYQIVGGSSTSSFHAFQSYGGSAWRNMFEIRHAATATGTQNYPAVYSTNSGGFPSIEAVGGDTNISFGVYSKGSGNVLLNGGTTVGSTGAVTTTQAFVHSGSTAHTVSTTGAVSFTGNIVNSTRGFATAEFSAGSGAPGTINWSNGQNQTRTLTSSGTVTLSNPVNGSTYKLRVVQGGAGSFTITWPTIKWAGGVAPTLSTAVGAEDIITLYYNGTSYYGQASTGFA